MRAPDGGAHTPRRPRRGCGSALWAPSGEAGLADLAAPAQPDLDGRTGIQALRDGDVDRVAHLASILTAAHLLIGDPLRRLTEHFGMFGC